MPEYRAIRQQHSMLEVINSPKLSAEVTLQPMDAFEFDASIIFSDILPPLVGMGLQLDFVKGSGPEIANPIESPDDVSRMPIPQAAEVMGPTLEAIRIVSRELASRGKPLIGFAGAPFTLACYSIQGSGSKMYEKAKQFMYTYPDAWAELMDKLVEVDADYLLCQAEAGASALQVFDSWAGVLSMRDYQRFIQPHNTRLFEKIRAAGVPLINFSTGTATHLDQVAACGGDVIGVDWRMPLDRLWAVNPDKGIQGNLDPTVLLGGWAEVQLQVDSVLQAAGGRDGHIFNLGHGILPPTPMDMVRRVVDYVHESTAR